MTSKQRCRGRYFSNGEPCRRYALPDWPYCHAHEFWPHSRSLHDQSENLLADAQGLLAQTAEDVLDELVVGWRRHALMAGLVEGDDWTEEAVVPHFAATAEKLLALQYERARTVVRLVTHGEDRDRD